MNGIIDTNSRTKALLQVAVAKCVGRLKREAPWHQLLHCLGARAASTSETAIELGS
jgi:hypothetical protein